jgi:hypothetical protein
LSPNQLRNWKKEFLENATRVFAESKQEKELRAKLSTYFGELIVASVNDYT